MSKKYLDDNGLLYLWGKVKAAFVADLTWDATNRKLKKTKNGSNSDLVTFSNVALTGSYNDLSNKPATGVSDVEVDGSSVVNGGVASLYSFDVLWDTTNKKLKKTKEGTTSDVVAFSNVALSGSYNDLGDKPITGVSDVKVDGASVVSSAGVASIALNIGSASGICPLDANAKVDAQFLPSYVDDVIEAYPVSSATELSAGWLSLTSGGTAFTPEAGKLYVLMASSTNYSANDEFRWGGTTYVKLADSGMSSITNSEIDIIVAS